MTNKELQQRVDMILAICERAMYDGEMINPKWLIYMLTLPPAAAEGMKPTKV